MKKKVLLIGIMALTMIMGSCKSNATETAGESVEQEEVGKESDSKFDFDEAERKCAENAAQAAAEDEEYVTEQLTDDTTPEVADDRDGVVMLQPGQSLPQPGDKPVVVDLFATWCGPCQTYGPIFDNVATRYAGKAVFVRVDVDQNPEISANFEISAIPTTVILARGKEPVKIVGLLSQTQLQEAVEQALR